MQVKTFIKWSKFSKTKREKKSLMLMINRMQRIRQKISFARWKIFTSYDIITEGLEVHSSIWLKIIRNPLVFGYESLFNKWGLFAKNQSIAQIC